MTYMLDTNICIYAMKNKPEHVLQRLKKELNSGICISSITLAELEYGMKHSSNPAKNEQALLRFLIPLSILPFGAAAASEYGEIRSYLQDRGTPIGPLDKFSSYHLLLSRFIWIVSCFIASSLYGTLQNGDEFLVIEIARGIHKIQRLLQIPSPNAYEEVFWIHIVNHALV